MCGDRSLALNRYGATAQRAYGCLAASGNVSVLTCSGAAATGGRWLSQSGIDVKLVVLNTQAEIGGRWALLREG